MCNITNYISLICLPVAGKLGITIKTLSYRFEKLAVKKILDYEKIKKVAERSVNRRRLIAKLNWRYQK